MIRYDVPQKSEAWDRLRNGIPTASEFKRILTAGGKPSRQAGGYMNLLLAEWYFGAPLEDPKSQYESDWMTRGNYLEDQAVRDYEFQRDVETERVGIFLSDDRLCGASPDRLVGDDGILEIKCPAPSTHAGYMLTGSVEDEYAVQLQGQLWLTGRDWVDIHSYCPGFPSVTIRVHRDAKFIHLLSEAVGEFIQNMLAAREDLIRRYGSPRSPTPDPLGVSEADIAV